MEDAGPALSGIAPDMRAGQAQRLAHELDQQGSILDLPRHGTSVDLKVDLNHFAPSPFRYTNTLDDDGLARKDQGRGALHQLIPGSRRSPPRHMFMAMRVYLRRSLRPNLSLIVKSA